MLQTVAQGITLWLGTRTKILLTTAGSEKKHTSECNTESGIEGTFPNHQSNKDQNNSKAQRNDNASKKEMHQNRVGGDEQQRILSCYDKPNNTDSLIEEESGDLIENAYLYSKDQAGCRMLQKKLELNEQTITNKIFDQVAKHYSELMMDPFGNYLCQKLIETCTQPQTAAVIEKVTPELIPICLNPHGTRAVQKIIEVCSSNEKLVALIIKTLANNVVRLVKV